MRHAKVLRCKHMRVCADSENKPNQASPEVMLSLHVLFQALPLSALPSTVILSDWTAFSIQAPHGSFGHWVKELAIFHLNTPSKVSGDSLTEKSFGRLKANILVLFVRRRNWHCQNAA